MKDFTTVEDLILLLERVRHERDEAIEQRDEARKQICESNSRNCYQAYQHAIECNWDCYKETP